MIRVAKLLAAIGAVLAAASTASADIGVVVLEPIGPLGFMTRVGHAATYLSNICPDGSAVKMRLCRPGEHGGVVSKYTPFSEHEDYDWAIVPFEEYMHGSASSDLAPLFGTRKLQAAIAQYNFGPLFSSAIAKGSGAATLPEGEWRSTLSTRFERSLYIFSVETTAVDDDLIVAAFNAAPNKSRFNFFYRNCSNQSKAIFDLILRLTDTIGDRSGGLTTETPKGLVKSLVDHAIAHPELQLRVRRYPQIPGTAPRSHAVLFPLENTYRSVAFAPYWFFGGFREFALAAMFYHQVISPFSMREASRDFMSPDAARLTDEQHRLRRRQDEMSAALVSLGAHDASRSTLLAMSVSISRRLGEIRREKRAQVRRATGSERQWRELDTAFHLTWRAITWQRVAPEPLRQALASAQTDGQLSEHLLQYFESSGKFSVDEAGRGPWMAVPLPDGTMRSTGVSRAQILAGDPHVAVLVLAAVIDYNLRASPARREDIADINALFTLFRQASTTIRELERDAE